MENQNPAPAPGSTPVISHEDKNAAAISYVWIMSVIIFAMKHKVPYVRFHASQSSALFVLSIIFWFIPVINQGLELFLGILMVMGFVKAAQGSYFKIPLISQLVFSSNPIKTSFLKIGQALSYLLLSIRVKFVNNPEMKAKLAEAKKELVTAPDTKDLVIDHSDIKRHNDIAAVSYVWILSVITSATNRESDFIRFHASQGVVLFAASCLFAPIPVLGFYLNVLILLLSVLGFIMAFSGESYRIPVVSYIAKKNPTFQDFYLNVKSFFVYIRYTLHRSMEEKEKKTWEQIREEVKTVYLAKTDLHDVEVQENKDIAAASYVFIGPLIWFIHKKKPFVVFHARQATLLLVFAVLLALWEPIRWLAALPAAMMVLGFIRAQQSQFYYMPFIYDMVTSRVTLKDVLAGIVRGIRTVFATLKRLLVSSKDKNPTPPPATPTATVTDAPLNTDAAPSTTDQPTSPMEEAAPLLEVTPPTNDVSQTVPQA